MFSFVFVWVVIGLFAGFLANAVMRGGRGLIFDVVVGLLGAVVAGFAFGSLLGYRASSLAGHVGVAFLGALALLALMRLVQRPRHLFR